MKVFDLSLQDALKELRSEVVKAKIEYAQAKTRSSKVSKSAKVSGLVQALKIMERIIP